MVIGSNVKFKNLLGIVVDSWNDGDVIIYGADMTLHKVPIRKVEVLSHPYYFKYRVGQRVYFLGTRYRVKEAHIDDSFNIKYTICELNKPSFVVCESALDKAPTAVVVIDLETSG